MDNVFKNLDDQIKGLTNTFDDLLTQYTKLSKDLPNELKGVYLDAINQAKQGMKSVEGFSPQQARNLTKVVEDSTAAYLNNQKK